MKWSCGDTMSEGKRIETRNEDGKVIRVSETFLHKTPLVRSTQYGQVLEKDDYVELTVNMNYDFEEKHGSFEFYKTDTDEWYESGGLWVNENNELADYDGVYSLMDFVLDWLQGATSVDVSDMRECLFGPSKYGSPSEEKEETE